MAAVLLLGATVATWVGLAEPAPVPGFDRSCGRGHGCVFGPAWSDDVSVAGGHNGCDTRNDQLRQWMRDVQLKPDAAGCVVMAGELTDPYSGVDVVFSKARAADVQVDHVWPLSQAWNRGAAGWPVQARIDFANDPVNLIVTTATINRAKSDKMPDEWSPTSPEGRCLYVSRFQQVADKYLLEVNWKERAALVWTARGCPSSR